MTNKEYAYWIRRYAVEMTNRGNSSHIASILSMADIVAVLFNEVLNISPSNPKNPDRDRFILSKGHAGAGVYAALALKGFFDKEVLYTHSSNGSILSAHVSHKGVNGVELSTGSLGHGLSVGCGMALAAKLDSKNNKVYKVYVLLGDGECNEGSVWEACLFANQFNLSNLTIIIDNNRMQGLGNCEDVLKIDPLSDKFESFGMQTTVIDGHNTDEIKNALLYETQKPKCIIAKTIKGKGVSFMENNLDYHYKSPQGEFYHKAILELENRQQK